MGETEEMVRVVIGGKSFVHHQIRKMVCVSERKSVSACMRACVRAGEREGGGGGGEGGTERRRDGGRDGGRGEERERR